MFFLNDSAYKWKNVQEDDSNIYYKGDPAFPRSISALISSSESQDLSQLAAIISDKLVGLTDYNSGAIETPEIVVAWVDHIRSWPLFYTHREGKGLIISPNARLLKDEASLDVFNERGGLEFAMAGYVTGRHTLYEGLYCLQPGEFLVCKKGDVSPMLHRYHRYIPDLSQSSDWTENQARLGEILDNLTLKIIARANGKTIWVPLSAGLDSRILLCKLHEHGYPHIQTFTYGPAYNFEAIHAKKIAKRLSIPWRMITLSNQVLRACFENEQRKQFWHYADGLKTIPCMREYSAIDYLYSTGTAKEGDIFLNGQSGDYITGGHIPDRHLQTGSSSEDGFFDAIINKHYDLWHSLKTNKNLKLIKQSIEELLSERLSGKKSNEEWAKLGEMWEYDGRQICYVANGQRIYEFFGFDWEMPLWEKELVDFCQTLPLEQKANQALYKAYLRDYNYMDLFPKEEPHIWRWPLPMLWVVPVAYIIGLIAGRKVKDGFYFKMRRYGHYTNQYQMFSRREYKNFPKDSRSMISLFTYRWCAESKVPFFDKIWDR